MTQKLHIRLRTKAVQKLSSLIILIAALTFTGGLPASIVAAQDATSDSTPETTTSAPAETGEGTTQPESLVTDPTPAQTSSETPPEVPAATGPDNTAAPASTQTTQTTQVQQNINSDATSGDATVSNNDDAGSATSGSATANATVINVVNNAAGFGGNAPVTKVWDIHNPAGSNEIQGNITIDPSTFLALPSGTTTTNLAQNSASLVDIENNVTVSAISGDATVSGNDDAGDATSGDATAIANIINVVSSAVGAENSFLGVVNIYGNLRGDILVPASFVDSLLASNNPATAAANGQAGGNTTTNVNITNNVTLDAESGRATVSGNDDAGDATSGDAATKLTVFNLTGQQVIAKNSLLVFVNVLGQWVGMIVPAPGSTAAALGGGTASATGSQSAPGIGGDHESTVNIRNNVSVAARSGDATVSDNDDAGSARSGDATASANILNLVNTSYNLEDWFGILFINVIGSWLGNFDIAANPQTPAAPGAGQGSPQPTAQQLAAAIRSAKVFQFSADTAFTPASQPADDSAAVTAEQPVNPAAFTSGQVLGQNKAPGASQALPASNWAMLLALAAGLILVAAMLAAGYRRLRRAA